MKKKLSVLLIMAMAFVCTFMLTACDPEIIEKIPEQLLAETFALLDDNNYVVDASYETVSDGGKLNERFIAMLDGNKFSYESYELNPGKHYYELVESRNKAYYYAYEMDYGYVREEIDVETYNSAADVTDMRALGLFDATKYTLASTEDAERVFYKLKDEYVTGEINEVIIYFNTDGGFTAEIKRTLVLGTLEGTYEMTARFYDFGKVKVDLPTEFDVIKTDEDYKNEFNAFFELFSEFNYTAELNLGNPREYIVLSQAENDMYSYVSVMNRRVDYIINNDGSTKPVYYDMGFIIEMDNAMYEFICYSMLKENDFTYASRSVTLSEAMEMLKAGYYQQMVLPFASIDNFEYRGGGVFGLTEEAKESAKIVLGMNDMTIEVGENEEGETVAYVYMNISNDDGSVTEINGYIYNIGTTPVMINKVPTQEVGG